SGVPAGRRALCRGEHAQERVDAPDDAPVAFEEHDPGPAEGVDDLPRCDRLRVQVAEEGDPTSRATETLHGPSLARFDHQHQVRVCELLDRQEPGPVRREVDVPEERGLDRLGRRWSSRSYEPCGRELDLPAQRGREPRPGEVLGEGAADDVAVADEEY